MTPTPEQVREAARTDALRQALASVDDWRSAADLLFLEAWLAEPAPGTAAALRVGQLRRANPQLAAAILAELRQTKLAVRPLAPPPAIGRASSDPAPQP